VDSRRAAVSRSILLSGALPRLLVIQTAFLQPTISRYDATAAAARCPGCIMNISQWAGNLNDVSVTPVNFYQSPQLPFNFVVFSNETGQMMVSA
jgi:predicted dithiol-disulfide oxidoreductase (DUF899 family)